METFTLLRCLLLTGPISRMGTESPNYQERMYSHDM